MPTEQERAIQYLVDKAEQERRRRELHAGLAGDPAAARGLWDRTKALWGRWPSNSQGG